MSKDIKRHIHEYTHKANGKLFCSICLKPRHEHAYTMGKSGKVMVCRCGDFKHINLKPEDIIKEQR